MVELKHDKALSELIGFILLLALLILVASLYLTYVVPANGREAEIAHMDYIKGQFLNYKINTDALWINRESVTIAQAITLGTQGVKTTGTFAGFQLFSPVFSSAELSVRNTSERFSIGAANPLYSSSFVSASEDPGTYTPYVVNKTVIPVKGDITINQTPDHWYLNFNTSLETYQDNPVKRRYPSEFPSIYGAKILGKTPEKEFLITLKAVPRYLTQDLNWTYQFLPPDSSNNLYWIRYQTDLLLSITRGTVNTLENYPVYTNIKNSTELSTDYTVDLLNPAYGFVQQNNDYSYVTAEKYNSTSSEVSDFHVTSTVLSGYTNASGAESDIKIIYPVSGTGYSLNNQPGSGYYIDKTDRLMGRVEYNSHNVYYRTQQNFIYQMGGIFVNQTEGSSPLNLPLISVKQPDADTLAVDITDISISGDNTTIGGSSPVQIQTTLNSIRGSALDISQPNAASVVLKVENTNLPELWRLIFRSIKRNAGPGAEDWIDVSGDQNSAVLTIEGPTGGNITRDIIVTVTYVDYDVELDAVGKTTGI